MVYNQKWRPHLALRQTWIEGRLLYPQPAHVAWFAPWTVMSKGPQEAREGKTPGKQFMPPA